MKQLKFLFCSLFVFSIIGCNETSIHKVSSSGKPYDVFVVISDAKWKGAVGDTIRSIMLEEVEMLNQREPLFDLYQVAPANFKGIVREHRNAIIYEISPKYTSPSMTAMYDVTASPQLIVNINAASDSAAIRYMDQNRTSLQEIFNKGERDVFIKNTQKHNDPIIKNKIKELFGIDLTIPRGYKIRKADSNFLWISLELPIVSEGVFIYKYPLTDRNTFTPEYLFDKRNEFAKRIPGPSAGSYMINSEEFFPSFEEFRLNGRLWFEMKGFWDVKGDFMGGPYVSNTTILGATREVITIDSYVFSPKHGKRNYIREIESLVYMVNFPNDSINRVKTVK